MKRTIALFLSVLIAFSVFGMISGIAASFKYGDVNGDGSVTTDDALKVLQNAVGKISFDDNQKKAADVDKDGNVTTNDALWVLQCAVGKRTLPDPDPIGGFPPEKSSIDTGAYTIDETADNSFVLDVSNLESKTIYVYTAGVEGNDLRLVTSLQGLLNRGFGMDNDHTTLLYVAKDGTDAFWLRNMRQEGIFKDFKVIALGDSMDTFLSTFKEQLKQCGMVLWDQNVPATANVAGTICGADGYLPVMSGIPLQATLANLGVEVKMDLTGMFTGTGKLPGTDIDSTGSKKNDAYLWALEKYMDRCSANYMGYILDGAVTIPGNEWAQKQYAQFHCIMNMDYLIARHAFLFDLQPNPDETACDDPGQPVGLDNSTLVKILKRRYERANGEIGQMMGFPPWWIKYTIDTPGDTGKNGKLGGPQLEWLFCEYITSYNMAMEADAAHPCSMSNGSAYYKYCSTTTEFKNSEPAEKMTFDSSKRYFTIYVGDYDSSAWMKQYIKQYWDSDATRGSVDLMWCFNPNLSNRIPVIWDYIYKNKTDRDYIEAGEGAGYTMPGRFVENIATKDLRTKKDGFDKWVAYSKKYYKLFDIDITGFIINTQQGANEAKGINRDIMEAYNQFSPVGSFTNAGSTRKQALALYDGTPYVYLFNEVSFDETPSADRASEAFKDMFAYDTGVMSSFNFSAYRTIVQSPTDIKALIERYIDYAGTRSGQEYVYVDPYNFFDLVRQSGQGTSYDNQESYLN